MLDSLLKITHYEKGLSWCNMVLTAVTSVPNIANVEVSLSSALISRYSQSKVQPDICGYVIHIIS